MQDDQDLNLDYYTETEVTSSEAAMEICLIAVSKAEVKFS